MSLAELRELASENENKTRELELELEQKFEQARRESLKTGVNPKDLIGSMKVPLSLVPYTWVAGTSLALQEGAIKYGPFNWRDVPVQMHIYIEAALGHMMALSDGQDIDTDSGLHHVLKASACMAIIWDGLMTDRIIDTRHSLNKPGAGTFTRDPLMYGSPDNINKIKELMSKPYVKTIGKPKP